MADGIVAKEPEGSLVWLASYPKSGNTWLRALLAAYLNEQPIDGFDLVGSTSGDRAVFDNTTGLSSSDLTDDEIDLLRPAAYRRQAAGRSTPCFMKVHDAWYRSLAEEPIFPADRSRGAILVVRHPMDVAVSYAHHMGHADYEVAVDHLGNAEEVMGGGRQRQFRQRTFGWSGHYRSWTCQNEIAVLTIRYEDMLADTAGVLRRVVTFLDLPAERIDARIAHAVDAARFDRLQALEVAQGFVERPVAAQRFFRSGRAGDGIAGLSARLKRRIIDEHGAAMRELGYSRDGSDVLKPAR